MIVAFRRSESVFLLTDIFATLGYELGIFDSLEPREAVLDGEVVNELGRILKEKIEALDCVNDLSEAPFYYSIARTWAYLSGSGPVRMWLASGIEKDAKFMAKVCIGLVSYSINYDGKNYNYHGKKLADYYDLDVLQRSAGKHRGNEDLSGDERRRIAAVDDGLRQLSQQEQ